MLTKTGCEIAYSWINNTSNTSNVIWGFFITLDYVLNFCAKRACFCGGLLSLDCLKTEPWSNHTRAACEKTYHARLVLFSHTYGKQVLVPHHCSFRFLFVFPMQLLVPLRTKTYWMFAQADSSRNFMVADDLCRYAKKWLFMNIKY